MSYLVITSVLLFSFTYYKFTVKNKELEKCQKDSIELFLHIEFISKLLKIIGSNNATEDILTLCKDYFGLEDIGFINIQKLLPNPKQNTINNYCSKNIEKIATELSQKTFFVDYISNDATKKIVIQNIFLNSHTDPEQIYYLINKNDMSKIDIEIIKNIITPLIQISV